MAIGASIGRFGTRTQLQSWINPFTASKHLSRLKAGGVITFMAWGCYPPTTSATMDASSSRVG
jgi:hypothetical protein